MKIAFAYESAYPWFNGGIEKRRYNILRSLAKDKSNEMHMFTLYRTGMPGMEFKYEGVQYHCVGKALDINKMYSGGSRTIYMSLKFSVLLFFKMLKYRFDIIDTDAFPFLHIPLLALYSRLRRAKLVITWHEVWSKSFWLSYMSKGGNFGYFMEKLAAKLGYVHIANTTTTKQLLERLFRVKPEKIMVLPAAVYSEEIKSFLRRNAGKCKKENKFVVVNRLVKHKRTDIAIRSMRDVNAKLVIIGKGPELDNLKELANKEHIKDKVEFKQDLSIEQLYKELCTSIALIMPSEREGLSLITAEALALGVPVAVVDTTMLPEEIKSLCSEIEEDKLGTLLNDMLKNRHSYEKEYEEKRSKAMSRFSSDAAEEVYKKIEEMHK